MTESVKKPSRTPKEHDDEIDLGRLIGHLIDHKWWIISITAVFMVFGVAYALIATPIYKADALLQIEEKSSGMAALGEMGLVKGVISGTCSLNGLPDFPVGITAFNMQFT